MLVKTTAVIGVAANTSTNATIAWLHPAPIAPDRRAPTVDPAA